MKCSPTKKYICKKAKAAVRAKHNANRQFTKKHGVKHSVVAKSGKLD